MMELQESNETGNIHPKPIQLPLSLLQRSLFLITCFELACKVKLIIIWHHLFIYYGVIISI